MVCKFIAVCSGDYSEIAIASKCDVRKVSYKIDSSKTKP